MTARQRPLSADCSTTRQVGIYGHNHRSVADTLNQIAVILCGMEQHAEGLEKYQEALDISMSILGSSHPDIATSLAFIGAAHERHGDQEAAGEYYKQAAEIWEGMGLDWQEHLDLTRTETAKEWSILRTALRSGK